MSTYKKFIQLLNDPATDYMICEFPCNLASIIMEASEEAIRIYRTQDGDKFQYFLTGIDDQITFIPKADQIILEEHLDDIPLNDKADEVWRTLLNDKVKLDSPNGRVILRELLKENFYPRT